MKGLTLYSLFLIICLVEPNISYSISPFLLSNPENQNNTLKIKRFEIYTMKMRHFKGFVKSYKEAIVFFGNTSNSDTQIEEIDNLEFQDNQYFEFKFGLREVVASNKLNFHFNFEDVQIAKTFSYVVKSTDETGTYYVYHYVIKRISPSKSTLYITFPDGTIKKYKP